MASGKWSVRHVLAVWSTLICTSLVITAPGVGALRFLNDPKIVLVGYSGYNFDFNCTTDDPNATVSLWHSPKRGPLTERPLTPGKLILSGQVFSLVNLVRSDGGMYACKATSESGQSIQWPFGTGRLLLVRNVLPRHFVLIPSKPVTVLQGKSESVTCESEGVSVVTLKWEKQADLGSYVDVPAGWVTVINDTSTNRIRAVLKITNAKLADTGVYKCTVAMRNKSTYKLIAIRVVGPKPAKITVYSESSLKVNPNQAKLKIKCEVTGFPEPVVTWRKDGKVISDCAGQRDCRYHEQYDGLQIRQPRYPDDDAVFSCEARNKYGSDSKTFTVVVPAPPVLDHSVPTVIFFADSQSDPVYIPCVLLEGSPYPTFQWSYQLCLRQKGLTCVPWRDIGDRPAEFKAMNSSSQNTLRIIPSRLPPRLKFRCKATNYEGRDEITFELLKRAR